jgi:predicted DNA-binding transcriptional regulator AlpA
MKKEEFVNLLRQSHQKMLLNKKQVANELGISQASVDRLRSRGQLASKKVLGQIMFSIDEIARFMADA